MCWIPCSSGGFCCYRCTSTSAGESRHRLSLPVHSPSGNAHLGSSYIIGSSVKKVHRKQYTKKADFRLKVSLIPFENSTKIRTGGAGNAATLPLYHSICILMPNTTARCSRSSIRPAKRKSSGTNNSQSLSV